MTIILDGKKVAQKLKENLRIENNWIDGLDITLSTSEVNQWLSNY